MLFCLTNFLGVSSTMKISNFFKKVLFLFKKKFFYQGDEFIYLFFLRQYSK